MSDKTYEMLLKKYDHEIKTQREMIGAIREEAFKSDEAFNPEKFEYLQHVYSEYTCYLWFLFHYDAEQLEKGNNK